MRPDSPGEPGMHPRDPCLPWTGPGLSAACGVRGWTGPGSQRCLWGEGLDGARVSASPVGRGAWGPGLSASCGARGCATSKRPGGSAGGGCAGGEQKGWPQRQAGTGEVQTRENRRRPDTPEPGSEARALHQGERKGKLMSIESVMPSNHPIICHTLLLPSIKHQGLFLKVGSLCQAPDRC